jgi:predicted dehydrogenase
MDELGILVVGCGYWGSNYVRIFGELRETRVVGVCDASPDRLEAMARLHPGIVGVQDLDAALALPGVGAVVVATPATTHFAVTGRVLSAGFPVLVEKPLTTDSSEALELITLAARQRLTLMVGHTFVYNAAVHKVRSLLDADTLGKVYYMYARRTSLGPVRSDVDAPWDLASHDVSIFNYLLGVEPEWVSAIGSRVLGQNLADVGFISIGYPRQAQHESLPQDRRGVVAHIHVSWADPNKTRELVVVGSEKQVVFNDLNHLERIRVFSRSVAKVTPENPSYGEFMFQLRDGDIVSPLIEASEPLKNECSHFVDCVRTGATPITGGTEGRTVVRVMEAIDESIVSRGIPVFLGDGPQVEGNGVGAPSYAVR